MAAVVDKLLVTGCRGQLGRELVAYFSTRYDVIGVGREECDIINYDHVLSTLLKYKPEIVLHAAACTDVDGCERKPELAMSVNSTGTGNIACACREVGARMIYYSTDYVFDGNSAVPYVETDVPNPQSVYGQSKLDGERIAMSKLSDCVIMRVAWLYGAHGRNFVQTMVQLGLEQIRSSKELPSTLAVVDDQIGNPTWTYEIARQTESLLAGSITGVVHATSEGETSRYGLATRIFNKLEMPVRIRPCASNEFPRPATRPMRSSLNNRKLCESGLNVMRDWKVALAEFLNIERGKLIL